MKEKALALAVQQYQGQISVGASTIVSTAQLFEQYLSGALDVNVPVTPVSQKTEVIAAVAAKPIKEAKPAKPAKVEPAKPAKTEEQMAEESLALDKARAAKVEAEESTENTVDAEEVKGVIESLLKANKRKELIALFGKYKAKSFSSIAESDWAKFHNDASDILMSA